MKTLLALLIAAVAYSASAGTITLNDYSGPADYAYTVEWGSKLDGWSDSFRLPNGALAFAFEYPWIQMQDAINTVETADVVFRFPNAPQDVSFSSAIITVDTYVRPLPSSVTPTADGYGAVIRYGGAPVAAPDSGPGMAMAAGLFGLVAVSAARFRTSCPA